jgi:2'-deoxynucleoside 5'-phosphate N-hydrolase
MKVYFAGSIRGGRDDVNFYHEIILHLKNYAEVLTEHIGSTSLSSTGENNLTDKYIHDRDMEWLLSSNLVVAEVTNASLGVGYELGRALENNIPVLCLFRISSGKRLSAMIRGSKFEIIDYNSIDELKVALDNYFKQ